MTYKENSTCQIKNWGAKAASLFNKKTDGFFIEVGAYDGRQWSNTDFLADMGWEGIYVEADSVMANRCKESHARNRIITLNCACGDINDLVMLFRSTGISHTIDRKTAERVNPWNDQSEKYSTDVHTWVRSFRLDTLCNVLMVPQEYDLLVIDVEGAELQVLLGADLFVWRPHVIIVEVHNDDPKTPEVIEYIRNFKYKMQSTDGLNAIFVEESFNNE